MYLILGKNLKQSKLGEWLILLGYSVLMWGAIRLSFALGFASNNVVAIWPAAGIAVWVAMRYGWKSLPVIFFSHFVYTLGAQSGNVILLAIPAAGNAVAFYTAAVLLKKSDEGLYPLKTVGGTLRFMFVMGVWASLIAAAVGSAAVAMTNPMTADAVFRIGWRWFFSDLTGVVLIAPAFIALAQVRDRARGQRIWPFWYKTALGVLLSAVAVIILYVAMLSLPPDLIQYPVVLLTMPLCVWLALDARSDSSIPLLSATIIGALSLALASVRDAGDASFFAVQLYGVVVMATSLVLHATSHERLRAVRALANERKHLEDKIAARTRELREIAETDSLTGLANRRSFEASLRRVIEEDSSTNGPDYLVLLDLDHFKIVNDTSGHSAGDELLRAVAKVLRKCVRDEDIIGRLGGDEFALLLRRCPEERTRRIAERVRSSIESIRFRWKEEHYQIGASIGVVLMNRAVGSVEDAKQLADAACYAAKNGGRNRVHMTGSDVSSLEAHRGEVRWAQRLSDALETDRFILHGQVIESVDASAAQTENVEVLLRLRDMESRRLIPPGAFLPAAERYGLATKIDAWVVASLVHMLYMHSAFDASVRKYWVNLSATSVCDEQFVDHLVNVLSDSPIEPGLINFEIAETAVYPQHRRGRPVDEPPERPGLSVCARRLWRGTFLVFQSQTAAR